MEEHSLIQTIFDSENTGLELYYIQYSYLVIFQEPNIFGIQYLLHLFNFQIYSEYAQILIFVLQEDSWLPPGRPVWPQCPPGFLTQDSTQSLGSLTPRLSAGAWRAPPWRLPSLSTQAGTVSASTPLSSPALQLFLSQCFSLVPRRRVSVSRGK